MLDIVEMENKIKLLLQINNVSQNLDSLESMVIRSFLKSQGIDEQLTPSEYTIKGWIECLHKYLEAGQTISVS